MDVSKQLLQQHLFVVAVNAGKMTDELARKLEQYDENSFAALITLRIEELRKRAEEGNVPFVDPEWYARCADTLEYIGKNLRTILGRR